MPPSAPSGGGGGGGEKTSVDNTHYNEQLFGEYKKRKSGDGRAIKSKDIRKMIADGELPKLPPSKRNPLISMCLAWHTKGMCNVGCPCADDHKAQYSATEYQPLTQWCSAHYPGESA